MARDVKGNNKNFYKYIPDKRKVRENMGALKKEMGDLVTHEMQKAEVLHDFFAAICTRKCSRHTTQVAEGKGRGRENEDVTNGPKGTGG